MRFRKLGNVKTSSPLQSISYLLRVTGIVTILVWFYFISQYANIPNVTTVTAVTKEEVGHNTRRGIITTTINENDSRKKRSIVYLHIRKTGGTTLDRIFRSNCEWYPSLSQLAKQCSRALPSNNIILSQLIKKTIHATEVNQEGEQLLEKHHAENESQRNLWNDIIVHNNNITSFLFTIRNPIDRAISAFNMQHIDNTPHWPKRFQKDQHLRVRFYRDCFPTVKDIANVLGQGRNSNNNNDIAQHDDDCYSLGYMALAG